MSNWPPRASDQDCACLTCWRRNRANRLDFKFGSSAKGCKPRTFVILELAENPTFQVDNCYSPFVWIVGAIVSRGEDRYICAGYFATMSVLHLMVSRDEEPSVLGAEINNLGVGNVIPLPPAFIFEPLRKPLHGESGSSQTNSDRLSRKAVIEKKNAFLTPLFDVGQCALKPSRQFRDQGRNPWQYPAACRQPSCGLGEQSPGYGSPSLQGDQT